VKEPARFENRARRGREVGRVLLLLLLLGLPRLMRLTADPVPDMARAPLWDEGGWAQNARQHALFGQWVMDENAAGLTAAPLYSYALAGFYSLLGVNFFSTRLLTAASGILCCLVVFGFLRPRYGPGRATAVTLALGFSYFMLSHNRVALTETFQLLFIAASAGCTVLADRRPAWAMLAGACFTAAILSKASVLFFALVIVMYWAIRRRRVPLKEVSYFAAGALVVLGVEMVVVVLPHWDLVRNQMQFSWNTAFRSVDPSYPRLELLGWGGFGFELNGFFRQAVVPLCAVLLLSAARLGGERREAADPVEVLCWVWLAIGLAALGTQRFQPDRRFLVLMPAIAFLAVTACRRGGVQLPTRDTLKESGLLRRIGSGALLGGFAGLYASSMLGDSYAGKTLRWNLAILAGAVVLGWGWRWLPRRSFRLPVPLFLTAFLLLEPLRFGWALLHPTYTVIDASRTIARYERALPPGRHAIRGGMNRNLALETTLYTFFERDLPEGWVRPVADSLARYDQEFSLVVLPFSMRRNYQRSMKIETGRGHVPCQEFALWPDRKGRPRFLVGFLAKPGACRLRDP
jgi:4-amino-4-deoxy-L-arabinose transferase-like glycosyltransferase